MNRASIRGSWLAVCALLALGATCRREPSPPAAHGPAAAVADGTSAERPAPSDQLSPPPPAAAPTPAEPAANGSGRLIGIIAPHAGYEFSGAVAGWSWKQLQGAGAPPAAAAPAADVTAYQPQVAGMFYPGDPATLRSTVEGFLAAAEKQPGIEVGPIGVLIIMAPSHHYPFSGAAVLAEDAYDTPLGRVAIDTTLRARFLALAGTDAAVESGYFRREHALEVQLPFAQVALPGVPVLAFLVGDSPVDQMERLGHVVATLLRERPDAVVVASSDMSHFHPYDEAVALDNGTFAALTTLDLATFDANGPGQPTECPTGMCVGGMCGYHPVRVALAALQDIAGADARVVKLRYANTGDVTPERDRVVGYGALMMLKADAGAAGATP